VGNKGRKIPKIPIPTNKLPKTDQMGLLMFEKRLFNLFESNLNNFRKQK